MLEIIEAVSRKDIRDFATFPLRLYDKSPYYVPSFTLDELNVKNEKKNPSAKGCLVKCFLAKKDGKTVGRIAGIIVNASNEKFNEKHIRFSRFDFINDVEVCKALLDAVIKMGKENGMDTVEGPWGFNDTDREGMLTFGFDEMATYATNYNYSYYPEIMEKLGYEKQSEWVEFRLHMGNSVDPRYTKLAEMVKQRKHLRDVCETMSTRAVCKKYGEGFFECFNKAYGDLDNYIEIKGDTKKQILSQFATSVNKRYASVIVDENDKVVAFGVAIPSINRVLNKCKGSYLKGAFGLLREIKKPHGLELALIGVLPEWRISGVNAMIIDRIWRNVIEDGVEDVVTDPELTSNHNIISQWKYIDHDLIRRRQTYFKKI